MKFFYVIILLSIISTILSGVIYSNQRKSKYSLLKKKYKKLKRRNKRLINKNKELLAKIKSIQNKEDNEFTSSFLETSSDPLFKTMSRGFPLPRQTTYVGIQDGSKYQRLNYCLPGCIVKS